MTMSLLCPVCRVPMETMEIEGIEIDVCPSCNGIWLDEGELTALANLEPKAFEGVEHILVPVDKLSQGEETKKPNVVSERICPRCGVKLFSYRYGGNSDIVIDGCEQCGGIWLDAGELKKIFDYMDQLKRPLSPEEQAIVNQALAQSKLRMREIEDSYARTSLLARIAKALKGLF